MQRIKNKNVNWKKVYILKYHQIKSIYKPITFINLKIKSEFINKSELIV